ncbi:peptidyl-tRNA hydrolase 2, mitochondrial-like [Bombus pascuorum]|uniref:peptidyl-tRNA hydrolase 2, mitochondrial-like n=1 Tax=Bombus pascuorum TaxID=65598 RepID=UPI00298E9912|nr:peptidyl-tRNA hydrolase 2, mitochondrial-like [Bombus pascuorum]XP_060817585.1 peptidyl-tRNA hydrolase 2, mitochondrial-like [Bombus pascuorum]XP_060817586.1 peptidyl-tRNA hydrolase 2, mitochondrial-like [Bombus pascuorum]
MNITQILLQTATNVNVGFIISAIIGYSLYKIIAVIYRKKLQSSNDNCNGTLHFMHMYSDNYKLVLVIRTDLKMGKGKIAAQCAHAAIAAYKAATKYPEYLRTWEKCGQTKITVKVDSENALKEIAKQARAEGLLANIIQDAGQTQVKPGSKTVCAIGPGPAEVIDNVTGHLKLF